MFPEEQGLSTKEVIKRQQQYGLNVLPEKPPPSQISLFVAQLKSPLVYILLIASLVTMVVGHLSDAFIILIAVFINTILGYIQEQRATNALFALKKYVTHTAIVIREGKRIKVHATTIVPGEIVILDQGVNIPADGTLLFANRLFIDESLLTGESVPVSKKSDDNVFMGTSVASGQGMMKVETIGAQTKMGMIATHIQQDEEDTPLQRQLKRFSKQLVFVIAVLTVFVFLLGVMNQFSWTEIFVTSVALAVSSIPEGLLVSLTVVLAIGMQKIVKHNGLVTKLSAAETLGGITIICVDKTGTLTQGKMEVVDHIGDEKELAQQVLLANDLDDPMIISAFTWGRTVVKDFVSEHQRLDSIPFSPKERFFISIHTWEENTNMIFVNGAPELLLSWSNLTEDEKKEMRETIEALTKQGKRLIGFARKEVKNTKKTIEHNDAKEGLIWIGILAFSDPVRLGVKEALDIAKTAGIKTIVITGDYPKTSEFVLSELGMRVDSHEIMPGAELEKITAEELAGKVKTIRLFARTTPDQKLLIVNALKKNGEIVAMMGDGVNDALALKQSDVGVAMGITGTDVAKEAAEMVITDDNYATIVTAVEEGRTIFDNIKSAIQYLVGCNLGEVIAVLAGMLMGWPLILSPLQLLYVNLVTDGLPAIALAITPKRESIMNRKPRTGSGIFSRRDFYWFAETSLLTAASTLGAFWLGYQTGSIVLAQTLAFTTLILVQHVILLDVWVRERSVFNFRLYKNNFFLFTFFTPIFMQCALLFTPAIASVFKVTQITWSHAGTIFLLSSTLLVSSELRKHLK